MANPFEIEWEKPELDTLASLAQHLVFRLPECDDRMIRLTLRDAYRDFCRRSCCLRVRRLFEFDPCGEYVLPTLFEKRVYRVTEVCDGSHRLDEGRDYSVAGGVVRIFRGFRETRHDDPAEKPPRGPVIAWIEIPALSSERIPRWLVERHGDSICSGALARLMAMTNRPWSDPQMAVIEGQRFEAAVNEECQRLYAVGDSGAQGRVFDTRDIV